MPELIDRLRRRKPARGRGKLRPGQAPAQRELNTKRRGELAELAFSFKATSLGLHVSKPYGDSERYDFIVDNGSRLLRVQIKSTTTLLNGMYHVNGYRRTSHGVVAYTPDEIDLLVAYIVPEDTWYILPVDVIREHTSLLFAPAGYPRGPGLYAAYREAWRLLLRG